MARLLADDLACAQTGDRRNAVHQRRDVGRDNISAVSPDYKSPFPFGGTVRSVTIAMEK
jgi:hypothetical protein